VIDPLLEGRVADAENVCSFARSEQFLHEERLLIIMCRMTYGESGCQYGCMWFGGKGGSKNQTWLRSSR
jgi:hypothetical protein